MPERRSFLRTGGVAVAALIPLTAGCGAEQGPASDGNVDQREAYNGSGPALNFSGTADVPEEETLKVVRHRFFRTSGEGAGVMGLIKNVGDEPYGFVQASVTLYNDADESIFESVDDTDREVIDNLPAGGTWDFEVFFEDVNLENAARYELIVTGTRP